MKPDLRTSSATVAADLKRRSGFTVSLARSASSCRRLRAKRICKSALGLFGLSGVLGLSSGTYEINPVPGNELGPVLRPVRSLHLLDLPAQRSSPSVGIDRKQFVFVPTQPARLSGFQLLSLAPDDTGLNLTNPPVSILKSSKTTSNDQLAPLLRPRRSFHLLDLQHQLNSDSLGK
jgi:hypothetical protein